jgi:hypothetical protein
MSSTSLTSAGNLSAFSRFYNAFTHRDVIPWNVARFSLTPLERSIIRLIGTGEYPTLEYSEAISQCYGLLVAYRAGISVWNGDAWSEDSHLFLIELTIEDWERYCVARAHLSLEQSARLRGVRAFLDDISRQSQLVSLLQTIHETLLHMPPHVAFVGNTAFSSLTYWNANLMDRRDQEELLTTEMIKEYLEHHFEPNPSDNLRTENQPRVLDLYPDFQSI